MSLITITVLQLVCQLPGEISFLLIPLSALGCVVLLITVICAAAYCFVKQRARRGASISLMVLLPVVMWLPLNWVADVVHVGLTRGLGVGQIGSPMKSGDHCFAIYNWSVGLSIGPSTYLVHDPTGEIALPLIQHTRPPDPELGWIEECAGRAHHVIGHDYICSF